MNDVGLAEQAVKDLQDKLNDITTDKDEYLAKYKIQKAELKHKLTLAKNKLNQTIIQQAEKNGEKPLYCHTTHPKWKEIDKAIDTLSKDIQHNVLSGNWFNPVYVSDRYRKQHIYAEIIINDKSPTDTVYRVKELVNKLGGWTLENETGKYFQHNEWYKNKLIYKLDKPVIVVKKVKK